MALHTFASSISFNEFVNDTREDRERNDNHNDDEYAALKGFWRNIAVADGGRGD